MQSEWREVSLSDLGEVNRGKSKHRPRYAEHLYGGDYPFIQTGDIRKSGGRITSHSQTYSEEGLKQSRLWPESTMCITIAANIAETAILTYPACFPDSVVGFIADEEKCDVKFIEYTFRQLKTLLQQQAIGSVQDNINLGTLSRLRFKVPPLPEQKRIAHILGSLDDKIELNRKMNETLEAMAQAMFKSWFVDFDPVIDNALSAGNPIPEELAESAKIRQELGDKRKELPEDIRQLFPNEFELTDEMGWIPKGWEVSELSNYLEIKHGHAFKGKDFSKEPTHDLVLTPGNFNVGGGFKSGKFKYLEETTDFPKEYIFNSGELMLTMTDLSKEGDTLGYPAFIPVWPGYRFLHNQRLGKVVFKKHLKSNFCYQLFTTYKYREHILGAATGSTVKHTAPKRILSFRTLIPNEQLLNEFEKQVQSLRERKNLNEIQVREQAKTRDVLLPKLLSGELKLDDIELEGF